MFIYLFATHTCTKKYWTKWSLINNRKLTPSFSFPRILSTFDVWIWFSSLQVCSTDLPSFLTSLTTIFLRSTTLNCTGSSDGINTTRSRFSGKVWYAHCKKIKEQWKNECQRREIYLLLFTKYTKIRTVPRFFPPWWMGHYNMLCMCHKVYQQLVVIFVVTSSCVTEYLH